MTDYLFYFTIGPVQSFIFQARKTLDLYGGSFLLSHLSDTVLNYVSDKYGAQIIFPDKAHPFKPNVFLTVLQEQDDENISKIGNELQNLVEKELLQSGLEVLKSLDVALPTGFENQLKSQLQVYWSAVPLGQSNFKESYAKVQKTISSVKNARAFAQLEETGRKCSVSGEHNALFYRGRRKAFMSSDAVSIPRNVPLKFIANGENLGAMAFVKRCLERNPGLRCYRRQFPSTAGIALASVLNSLDVKAINQYRALFGSSFDEELFYSENIREESYFKQNGYDVPIELAKERLKIIYDEAFRRDLHLTKYYALILLDGDDMGKWRSGEFLSLSDDLRTFQKELAGKLTVYASTVQKVITAAKGQLVYCGGDDVLAFVNLDRLLPTLKEIRKYFPLFFDSGRPSTASAGVVIAHYKTPVREVVSWVKKMEKKAKNIDRQKDACSFAVLKRSGEVAATRFKWRIENLWTTDIMLDLLNAIQKSDFSRTFLKVLSREFRYFTDEPTEHQDDMVLTEIKRCLRRSYMRKEKDEIDKDMIDSLVNKVFSFYLEGKTFQDFLAFLDIVAFLEREVNNCAVFQNN